MSVLAQSATPQAAGLQRSSASTSAPENQSVQLLNSVLVASHELDQTIVDRETSWGEVISSIEAAQDEYSKKRGPHGANSIHNKKSLVMTLEALTDMIPDQDGLSVLRGGLKLLFKLVQRRTENRERIMAAFEDVPITFSQACEALTTHPGDDPLRESVQRLFNALVEEIPKLVTILLRAHKGSFHSRIFKQHPEHESSIISASLDAVSKASQRVWDRVRTLVDKTVVETLDVTRGVGVCVQQTQQSVQVIRESIACVQETQQRIDMRGNEQHAQTLAALSEVMDSKIRHATSQLDIRLHALQSMVAVSLNGSRQLPPAHSVPVGNLPQLSWPVKESHYLRYSQHQYVGVSQIETETRQSFYDNIYFTLDLPEPITFANDIGQVIRATNEMECQNSEPLEKAGWLLVVPRFQAWIKPTGPSDLILVYGCLGSLTTSKISALSVLCVMFVSARYSPDLVVLHHFCGLHSRHGEPGSGPIAMLRSLVSQLLLSLNQAATGATMPRNISPEIIVAAAHGELAGWCALFRILFYALPPQRIVYCVIDSIAEFETGLDAWESQICDAVRFLQALSTEGLKGPMLKILLTATQRSISVYKELSPERQIWLSSENRLP